MPGRILEPPGRRRSRAQGAVLARIDPAEVAAAVAAADAGIAQAERFRQRARRIPARAQPGRAQVLSQSAFRQRARSSRPPRLRCARAQREQAATVKGYTSVVSLLDGLVAARHIEPGEMAQPGRNLLTV